MGPGDVGAKNEMIATVWLLEQGYYVFRNVSPNGPVDIVAMKGGKTFLFDVKAAFGAKHLLRVSKAQKEIGVAVIHVTGSACKIDWDPPLHGAKDEKVCEHCQKPFSVRSGSTKLFCSGTCRQRQYRIDNPDWRLGKTQTSAHLQTLTTNRGRSL